MKGESLLARFLQKYAKQGECWVWQGWKTPAGYGRIRVNYRPTYAHRVAYELFIGPIPDGLQIDHLCRNRLCVRPDHLEAVTSKENCLRGESRPAKAKRAVTCPRGHLFDDENTKIEPDGSRLCRACKRLNNAKRYLPKGVDPCL